MNESQQDSVISTPLGQNQQGDDLSSARKFVILSFKRENKRPIKTVHRGFDTDFQSSKNVDPDSIANLCSSAVNIVEYLLSSSVKSSKENNSRLHILAEELRNLPTIIKLVVARLDLAEVLSYVQVESLHNYVQKIYNVLYTIEKIYDMDVVDNLCHRISDIEALIFDKILRDYRETRKSIFMKAELDSISGQLVEYIVRSIRMLEEGGRINEIDKKRSARADIDAEHIIFTLQSVINLSIEKLGLTNFRVENSLPNSPPNNETYDKKRPTESAPDFISRVYGQWLTGEFTRADLRKIDPKAEMALRNWERNKGRAPLNLPTKKELNDKRLSEPDDAVGKHEKLDRQRLRAARRHSEKRRLAPD